MVVTVISDTIQEFDGVRYYLCGFYFQRDGVRLHRLVWMNANQAEIPEGYHVHHIDQDRSNNQPENLELKTGYDHISDHHKGISKPFPDAALQAAAVWHGSEDGHEWHKAHYERTKHITLHQRGKFNCDVCGKEYETQINGHNRFCSNNCKSQFRRMSGVDNVKRICASCGSEFVVSKYSNQKNCSRKCRWSGPELEREQSSRKTSSITGNND